jgi:hypothetical protein
VTIGTIRKLAVGNGAILEKIFEEFFEPIDDTEGIAAIIAQDLDPAHGVGDSDCADHALAQYSLRDKYAEMAKKMLEHKFVLGTIAILGQWTMLFAPPNTGKTLIVLWLLIMGIKKGDINPQHVFYINADDSYAGLISKLKLAKQYGFHMLAPGHAGFQARDLLELLKRLGDTDQASKTIVILDTAKKFANPMDKNQCLHFGNSVREFSSKGGTVIALSHTNKNRAADGSPIPAGTSDFVDDADCVYVMDTLDDTNDICTVGFGNIKNRGQVSKQATYQYSTKEGHGYADLLDSVAPVADSKADALRDATDNIDTPVIEAISDCINRGVTGKGNIAQEVVTVTGCSDRHARRILDKYTGTSPGEHKWKVTRQPHGKIRFELLFLPEEVEDIEDLLDL